MKKHVKYSLALCALLVPGWAMAANFVPATGDYSVPGNWDAPLGAGDIAAVGGAKTATVTTTETIGSIHTTFGGSFTIATMACLGLVQNVYARRNDKQKL